MKATNLLHWVMCVVLYPRITMAIKTANKVGACCIIIELIVTLVAAWAIWSK
jgi:hypothetical protein